MATKMIYNSIGHMRISGPLTKPFAAMERAIASGAPREDRKIRLTRFWYNRWPEGQSQGYLRRFPLTEWIFEGIGGLK